MSAPSAARIPDPGALEAALRGAVSGEVRFDPGARAAYAADASNYRQIPIAVVLPRTLDDVVAAVAACRAHGAPILPRGGGTAQNGQSVNVAVVIDCSKYLDRVLAVDPAARRALVEPGTVCDALRDAAERHRLTFAPDPATHSRCTLGGMIGNNSCGPHSVMAGKTVENLERLEVLTYDGARFWCGPTSDAEYARIAAAGGRQAQIYARLKALADRYADLIRARYPKIKRRVSGYNLDQLLPENGFNVARALVGSEGSCALTLQAEVRLVESPQHRVLLVLGFPDIYAAGDVVPEILRAAPIACEGLDDKIVGGLRERRLKLEDVALLPQGGGWLMCEFGADSHAEAMAKARALEAAFAARSEVHAWLIEDPAMIARMWTLRETGASATSLALAGRGPDPVVGWEDAAVDPLRLGDYLREFQALIDRQGYRTSLYGHFGDGCIHARITFDLRTPEGLARWRGFLGEAAQLVVKYGGSLSGEHGDGQAKAEFLPLMYGPQLMQALREFKAIWDPEDRMNPRKLGAAEGEVLRADENLRLGPQYRPVTLATRFAFRSAVGDGFTRAVEHCIGMGKCRAKSGGTMCPSYRATGEERYSTRGRARLLFEMLQGEVITGGWDSPEVAEALEWCLACKGCKSDCPTHTDMASYKAEFLSHYFEKHRRPRHAHAMGRIGEWAPLAATFPRLANFLTQTPGLAALAKRMAGVAPQRSLPKLASRNFRAEWRGAMRAGDPVLLFADTFNDYFRPQSAHAAARVLEAAGCAVEVPGERLCCGRPYYDFGMLDQAKAALGRILVKLAPDIDAGTPLVVLEPACLSVFRDELANLFPDDARAARLARQAVSLAELLRARGWQPPARADGRALLHGHCHQKALSGTSADLALLRAAGFEAEAPDSGCCGMAGAFGFKPRHYEASKKIAELALLPKLRAAGAGTLIVADGFSCREQIEHLEGRPTLHLAEALARTLA
ncbi:MAG TPA: FAD-binding and (Fe-S)-binding domain-containing protein [Burkholderiales bacterium]|nr:FAD-binding and (Fe-S)-binding domain-containing protein [Burkholderiales bacterium]